MNITEALSQANGLLSAGEREKARQLFLELRKDFPEDPNVQHGLGIVCLEEGKIGEARSYLVQALEKMPGDADYMVTLGEIERLDSNFPTAERLLRDALEIDPGCARAYNNLGMVFLSQRRFVEAATLFMAARQLEPGMAMAAFNLSIAYRELNYIDEAIEASRAAIALQPQFGEAHVNLALALLVDGQLEEGFEEYEWRLRTSLSAPPQSSAPLWDGIVDSKGTLLVWAEQGLGDIIQFVRYLPLIAAHGTRIVVQCPAAVENLVQCVEGVTTCRPDEALPHHAAWIPLLSLPRIFETRVGKIPADIPYILPPFSKLKSWKAKLSCLGDKPKIGLRWAGNPENPNDLLRSVPLSAFAPLGRIDGIQLVSLDNRPPSGRDAEAAKQMGLLDYADALADFTDTAALIASLDMVITVDTSVLHLAGALGIPVWGLIKFAPDWRWMLGRSDSPWYPGLRLFRQSADGEWGAVVDAVAGLLGEAMRIHEKEH